MQDWFVIYRLICMKHTDQKWSDREGECKWKNWLNTLLLEVTFRRDHGWSVLSNLNALSSCRIGGWMWNDTACEVCIWSLFTVSLLRCCCCFFRRCFAALGDVSKARFLNETNKIADAVSKEYVCSEYTCFWRTDFSISNIMSVHLQNVCILLYLCYVFCISMLYSLL